MLQAFQKHLTTSLGKISQAGIDPTKCKLALDFTGLSTGMRLKDKSYNSNNATPTGDPTLSDGSIVFDGNNHLDYPTTIPFGTYDFSLVSKFKLSSIPGRGTLFIQHINSDGDGRCLVHLRPTAEGNLELSIRDSIVGATAYTLEDSLLLNTIYTAVVVKSSTHIRIYLNGTMELEEEHSYAGSFSEDISHRRIGRSGWSGEVGDPLHGTVYSFLAFTDTSLTLKQVENLTTLLGE